MKPKANSDFLNVEIKFRMGRIPTIHLWELIISAVGIALHLVAIVHAH